MLDIEYLDTPRPLGGVMVYLFRSGAFRRRMRECIRAAAAAQGSMLVSVGSLELAASWMIPDLLPSVRFCDLMTSKSLRVADRDSLIEVLKLKPAVPTVIFVPFNSKLRNGIQSEIEIVEEPPVTRANLDMLLDFLIKNGGLDWPPQLGADRAIISYFRRWLAEAGSPTLLELSREVDRALLLYLNRKSGCFEHPSAIESRLRGSSYLVRTVTRLVTDGAPYDVVDLLCAVSLQVNRGRSDREIADALCGATQRLVKHQSASSSTVISGFFTQGHSERLWLWSLLLLARTASIENENTSFTIADADAPRSLLVFDQLIRDFSRRAEWSDDPLVDLWSDISALARRLGKIDEGRWDNPYRLFQSLLAMNGHPEDPQWVQTVQRLAQSSEIYSDPSVALPEHRTLNGFADLIGRRVIVTHLRKRFETNGHKVPLAIVGESSSGKATIARIYAKALLCEGIRAPDGSACGTCEVCSSFDEARPFGYIEIDLAHPSASGHVRDHVAALQRQPFSEHRVVILKNPECASDILDVTLKPLEDGAYLTTFVVLAESKEELPPAVISRCDVFELRGLDLAESRSLLARWLPIGTDERVADVISMVNRGQPGKMAHSVCLIKEASAWDLASVKKVLGVGWAAQILRFWQSMFLQDALPTPAQEFSRLQDIAELTKQLRFVLWRLMRRHFDHEAALIGLEEQFFSTLQSLDSCLGTEKGKKRLLFELTVIWTADSIVDAETFLGAVSRSKFILASGNSCQVASGAQL